MWKDVSGYNGVYKVSDDGKVVRAISCIKAKAKHIGYNDPNGYVFVTLSKNNITKKYSVHRLVALHFIGKPPIHKQCINHIDGNKSNNNVKNLEFCSPMENTQHAIKIGLIKRSGSDHHKAKLTESDVLKIRNEYKTNKYTQTEIAKRFNVGQVAISLIIRKVNWKHI